MKLPLLLTCTNRFHASHVKSKLLPSDNGCGILVMFPTAFCTGVGHAVPVVVLIPVISLATLCVRFWLRVVVPLTFVRYALLVPFQLPKGSKFQSSSQLGVPEMPVFPALSVPRVNVLTW